MDNQARLQLVAQADTVADLAHHIGWTEVVLPKLQKMKELYTQVLVNAVLSNKPPFLDGQETTREQLAGRVYGIDYIMRLMDEIIRKGTRALSDLEAQGVTIDSKLH